MVLMIWGSTSPCFCKSANSRSGSISDWTESSTWADAEAEDRATGKEWNGRATLGMLEIEDDCHLSNWGVERTWRVLGTDALRACATPYRRIALNIMECRESKKTTKKENKNQLKQMRLKRKRIQIN